MIAKNRKWGKDFWNDLVGSDIDVETWIRGKIPSILDSDGIHKTFDVKYIAIAGVQALLALAGGASTPNTVGFS